MKLYPFADNRLGKTAAFLGLAMMLLLARDTLVTSCVLGFARSQYLMLFIMVLAGGVFLLRNRREWRNLLRDPRMLCVLVCALVLLLPMAVKGDWQMMYFSILLCPVFAVFLTYFTTTEQVAKGYVVLIAGLGAYSILACYLLRLLPDRGIWNAPVFTNTAGVDFYNFGLSFVPLTYCKNRNFGIFREPGVYQYFALLALFLNNYIVSWKNGKQLWLLNFLLGAVMLSTLAVGGYAEMALLALVVFFDKGLHRSKLAWAVALSLLASAAGLVLFAYVRKNMLWWEIYAMTASKFNPGETSGPDRVMSLFVNLEFFLKHPLFGAKLGEVLHAMEHNTSSTMLMFAIFGLPGALLHLAGWAVLVWKTGRKTGVKLLLLLCLMMSFNTQNMIADVFLWLFPTMALAETVGERKGRTEA